MSSRFSPKSGMRLWPVSRKACAAACGRDRRRAAMTIADRGRHQLGDVAAGQLDGVLEQLAGRLGEVGLDVLGVVAVGGDLDLDARRPGRRVGRAARAASTSASTCRDAEASAGRSATRSGRRSGQRRSMTRLGEDPADRPPPGRSRQRRPPARSRSTSLAGRLRRDPVGQPRRAARPASGRSAPPAPRPRARSRSSWWATSSARPGWPRTAQTSSSRLRE